MYLLIIEMNISGPILHSKPTIIDIAKPEDGAMNYRVPMSERSKTHRLDPVTPMMTYEGK